MLIWRLILSFCGMPGQRLKVEKAFEQRAEEKRLRQRLAGINHKECVYESPGTGRTEKDSGMVFE